MTMGHSLNCDLSYHVPPNTSLRRWSNAQQNKVAHHRIELGTSRMPCKTKTTMYQLSYYSIYILSQGTILEGFLILLESKNFVPDMTPEPDRIRQLWCYVDLCIPEYRLVC